MKTTAIALSIASLLISTSPLANTKAGELKGGFELDKKFNIDTANGAPAPAGAVNEFGAKLFMTWQGLAVSYKRKSGGFGETNINYTYGWEHVWLTPEFEYLAAPTGSDNAKLGLTVGSHVNGLFDTSLRYRKDSDTKEVDGKQSDIDRIDLLVGKQLSDSVYLQAKAISFTENDAATNAAKPGKDSWMNYEVKMDFTAVSDNMIPYVEYERAYIKGKDREDNNVKVGVVFPF